MKQQDIELGQKQSNIQVSETDLRNFMYNEKDWHLSSNDQLYQVLKSTENGITDAEAAKRLAQFGPNQITPPPKIHWCVKLFYTLIGGFQLMLWCGAILCFIVFFLSGQQDFQTLALAFTLVFVVLVTSLFQEYQEGKSEKVMDALRALSPQNCTVIRNGVSKGIPAIELTIGDIVQVQFGEKVPADIRVLTSSDLKVNNASLTGENIDIKLSEDPKSKTLYEAKNIARSGCNFTSGYGKCIVYSVGDKTFFGEISKSCTTIQRPETMLKREINILIKFMGVFATTLGIAFLVAAIKIGYDWVDAIIFVIGIIVANVPEGLLPQMTVALTLTAQRMLQKDVLVQNLEIIETLGAVSVICSDKTGTLTCNRMSVSHIVYGSQIHITPITPSQQGDLFTYFDTKNPDFQALQKIATLNSEAVFLTQEDDVLVRQTKGDASESAIIKFLQPIKRIEDYRKENKKLFTVPFNSTNKWMLTIYEQNDYTYPSILLLKGAPEKIIDMCSFILKDGKVQQFDQKQRENMLKINETLASRGERVLAFAHLELEQSKFPKGYKFEYEEDVTNFPLKNLVFVGFLSLIDPPRNSVKPAIKLCETAGIKVFMVTGDHPITAHAIAKALNLITGKTKEEYDQSKEQIPEEGVKSIIVHGNQMQTYKDEDWDYVLKHKEIVFARTMPVQKQEIVRQLINRNYVVGMTGDGVNDAPALKAANVGIAMGSGSAVAKEAGQIILLQDDFGNIVDGIKEGRVIFDNLKKCISYVLASNVAELIPFLLFISLKIPLGIETIVILLIDVGTDLAPAVSLAYEEPEDAIMELPPRTPDNHLVSWQLMIVSYGTIGVLETLGGFFGFFYVFHKYGMSFNQLIGAGIDWRMDYEDLPLERQEFFSNLCVNNDHYQQQWVNARGANCEQDFVEFRAILIGVAQSAYFQGVVWGQVANIFIRKTQVNTIFTWERFLGNHAMFWSLLIEFVMLAFFIYTPHVNHAFLLYAPTIDETMSSMWIIVVIVVYDELRKYFIRQDKKGLVARITYF